jgi:hypothetical protein
MTFLPLENTNEKTPTKRASLANRFLFLFLKTVFENKNIMFSIVFSLNKDLTNCFRKQFLKTENNA